MNSYKYMREIAEQIIEVIHTADNTILDEIQAVEEYLENNKWELATKFNKDTKLLPDKDLVKSN